jgi:hypothetical protein
MHIFGTFGGVMFLLGLGIFLFLGINKYMHLYVWHSSAALLSDQAVFYVALTAMILGTQLFLAGFLGELISRNSVTRNVYKVSDKIE